MGDVNKNVNLTFNLKDKASTGLKNVSKGMEDVTNSTKKASKETENFSTTAKSYTNKIDLMYAANRTLGGSLTGLATKLGALAPAALIAMQAYKELSKFVSGAVPAYLESEKALTKLTQAYGAKSKALERAAEAMQKTTIYDDDEVASSMALTAAFIKEETAIIDVSKAAADLAAARGMELSQATDLITKSVVSGTNALSRYGYTMKKSGDQGERLKSILSSIEAAHGGMAKAMAQTDAGKIKMLDNEYQNLQETIGKELTPGLIAYKKALIAVLDVGAMGSIKATKQIGGEISGLAKGIAQGPVAGEVGVKTAKPKVIGGIEGLAMIDKEISATRGRLEKFQSLIEENEAKRTEAVKKGQTVRAMYFQHEVEKYTKNAEKQKQVMEGLKEEQIKMIVQPTPAPIIRPVVDEAALQALADKIRAAQDSLNEELFKLDQEALSRTFEGKLKALEYSLEKEKEKYKKQYSEGLITLAEYYQMATALGDQYFNKKSELIDEEIKKNKELLDAENKIIEERANNRIEAANYLNNIEKSVNEQNLSNRESMVSSFMDREDKILEGSLGGRLELTKRSYLDELTLYQFMLDQKMIMQERYDIVAFDMQKEYQETQFALTTEALNNWVSVASQAAQQVSDTFKMWSDVKTQKEMDDIDETTKANKEAATKYIKNKKLLDKELAKIDKEAEAKKKELAKNEQKFAMIASIINTAQAVSGALTMKPPPLGIAMAILVGALGAVQTGIIASQAFAQGGIIQPEQGVPTYGDKTQVSANPGEMIINQRQQKNLLAMANGYGGGGGIQINETIVVQGNMDSNAIAELKQHREEWLEMLRDSNKQLKYRGYTYAQ